MPFSYSGFGGASGPLDSPIQIAAGEQGLWYFPRYVRFGNGGNQYTGEYNMAAVPLSFSRNVTLEQFRLGYFGGADSTAFASAGADAIMFRGAIYEADESGVPYSLVGDMGYTLYVPDVDAPDGALGLAGLAETINLEANKTYYMHFVGVAVTLAAGVPDTILASETFNLLSYRVGSSGPLDPMVSVGLTDAEIPYQPFGASGFFLNQCYLATQGAGNALATWPATLGPLWTDVFTAANPIVVAIRTGDQNA